MRFRLLSALAATFLAAIAPAAAKAPKHVILIMMENHGTDTILGNTEDAPFLNALVKEKGVRYATQYFGVTHPSLPNYLALASGDFMGLHDDCKAGAEVKCKPTEFTPDAYPGPMAGHLLTDDQIREASDIAHLFSGKTLVDGLDEAGVSWKIYMQSMQSDHKLAEYGPIDASGNIKARLYAQKHNPFLYFSSFRDNSERMARVVPFDGFAADLASGFPGFAWISPDLCHDMHGVTAKEANAIGKPECAYPKSGLDHSVIKLGDDFLRETVDAIRASPVWKDDAAIVIVWDEDEFAGAGGTQGSPIGRNGIMLGGGRAPLIVVTSKDTPPARIDIPYNHYNLLATIEAAYGVECLRHACDVKDAPIEGLFE